MQATRSIELTGPLEADDLLFHRMKATECLGRLFKFELDILSEDEQINIADVLAQPMTVRLDLPGDEKRYFNGFVSEFSYVGTRGKYAAYRATLRPWLWFLTRAANCRIFQEKTVPDIIKEVFRDHGFSEFEEKLNGSYRSWDFCVQYRETDFDFVSRLMEQEGIYYYFDHEDGKHTLVMADGPHSHDTNPGFEQVPYQPQQEVQKDLDHLADVQVTEVVQPCRYTLNDFDFEAPNKGLETKSSALRDHAMAEFEIYDWPGEYVQPSDGENYTRIRLEERQAQYETLRASGNVRGLSAGCLFKLTGVRRTALEREYLVVSMTHELQSNEYESSGGTVEGPHYQCSLTAIVGTQPYRSPRTTPTPKVAGPQTAIVTGPSGDAIWPDKHGRVKVKFHWDRVGASDATSSCWIRVSQPWAGSNWGGMFLPHVGQEVIVEFLEGDPDRPIITGRVYNGAKMPPEALPGAATKSIIRDHGGNEIVMEGAEGHQKITLFSPTENTMFSIGEGCTHLESDGAHIVKIGGDRDDKVDGNVVVVCCGEKKDKTEGNAIFDYLADVNESISGGMKKHVAGILDVKIDAPVFKIHGGLTSDTFIGGKHATFIGAAINFNAAVTASYGKSKDLRTAVTIKHTASTSFRVISPIITLDGSGHMFAAKGGGTSINGSGSKLILNGGSAKITIDGSNIDIECSKLTVNGEMLVTKKFEAPDSSSKLG